MDLKHAIATVKQLPEGAELVHRELANRVPEPVDLNTRLLARRRETSEQRAARLTGFSDVARPVSEAPTAPQSTRISDVGSHRAVGANKGFIFYEKE